MSTRLALALALVLALEPARVCASPGVARAPEEASAGPRTAIRRRHHPRRAASQRVISPVRNNPECGYVGTVMVRSFPSARPARRAVTGSARGLGAVPPER